MKNVLLMCCCAVLKGSERSVESSKAGHTKPECLNCSSDFWPVEWSIEDKVWDSLRWSLLNILWTKFWIDMKTVPDSSTQVCSCCSLMHSECVYPITALVSVFHQTWLECSIRGVMGSVLTVSTDHFTQHVLMFSGSFLVEPHCQLLLIKHNVFL